MYLIELSILVACQYFMLYVVLQETILCILCYEPCRRPIFISKYVSVINSLIVGSLTSFYLLGVLDEWMWGRLQCIPIGYCIYDLILIYGVEELRKKVENLVTLHHLLFIMFAYFVFPYRTYDVSLAYLSELSNPFLYACYHMIKTPYGEKYPRVFLGCTIGLMITFTIFRVINFAYLLYKCVYYGYHLIEIIGAAIIFTMNLYWYKKLLQKSTMCINSLSALRVSGKT